VGASGETAVRIWGAWLLAVVGLVPNGPRAYSAAAPFQIGSIEPLAENSCGLLVIDDKGQVSISCPGVDDKALGYLESKLTEQFLRLSKKLEKDIRTYK